MLEEGVPSAAGLETTSEIRAFLEKKVDAFPKQAAMTRAMLLASRSGEADMAAREICTISDALNSSPLVGSESENREAAIIAVIVTIMIREKEIRAKRMAAIFGSPKRGLVFR